MNPFMFTPSKNGIFPFPPLDGPPQRLERTREVRPRRRKSGSLPHFQSTLWPKKVVREI
jgi:hypothetical protein